MFYNALNITRYRRTRSRLHNFGCGSRLALRNGRRCRLRCDFGCGNTVCRFRLLAVRRNFRLCAFDRFRLCVCALFRLYFRSALFFFAHASLPLIKQFRPLGGIQLFFALSDLADTLLQIGKRVRFYKTVKFSETRRFFVLCYVAVVWQLNLPP